MVDKAKQLAEGVEETVLYPQGQQALLCQGKRQRGGWVVGQRGLVVGANTCEVQRHFRFQFVLGPYVRNLCRLVILASYVGERTGALTPHPRLSLSIRLFPILPSLTTTPPSLPFPAHTKNETGSPHGMIDLSSCMTVKSAELKAQKRNALEVSTPETTFLMYADTEKEKDDWIGAVGRAIVRSSTTYTQEMGEGDGDDDGSDSDED